jgi:two-component system, NarL family, nitrate/nitrite response regulator NarL
VFRSELIRSVIVSDVLLYRDGISVGLSRIDGFIVTGVTGTAMAPAFLTKYPADVVFLDMSRSDALHVPQSLCAVALSVPIIGFGVSGHDEAIACAEAGITAFVGAEGTIEDLAQAALLALEGKVVCSPLLTAKLVQRLAALADNSLVSHNSTVLTRREQQIASLVDDGLTNKEIACKLKISPATVKNHVHTILDKLNLDRRNAIGRHLSARQPQSAVHMMQL